MTSIANVATHLTCYNFQPKLAGWLETERVPLHFAEPPYHHTPSDYSKMRNILCVGHTPHSESEVWRGAGQQVKTTSSIPAPEGSSEVSYSALSTTNHLHCPKRHITDTFSLHISLNSIRIPSNGTNQRQNSIQFSMYTGYSILTCFLTVLSSPQKHPHLVHEIFSFFTNA